MPVYFRKRFVGVIGIEIDYSTMANEVGNITLFDNGYAFLNDDDGYIIYHPRVDVMSLDSHPRVPEGLLARDKFIRYEFDGVEKQAVWLPLSNGMRINVTVSVQEINAEWQNWIFKIVAAFGSLLVDFIILVMAFSGRITRPIRELTAATEQIDEGNYECQLSYEGKDEVGVLTKTFKKVAAHLKSYIGELNDLAYADALTSLRNKGAFEANLRNLQKKLNDSNGTLEFAVCFFDCNRLKKINDENGHDKGDIYLKGTADIICRVFDHSPVFRIGGDEFAALLLDGDYKKRNELLKAFDDLCAGSMVSGAAEWEKIDVARGLAVYDPGQDKTVRDVARRADKLMYEHKRGGGRARSQSPQ